MSGGFQHDIAGGQGNLIVTALQSPNFVAGSAGWQVAKDGSAQFNNLTIRGTFFGTDFILNSSGLFFYSGTPAAGNLIGSWATAPGSDQFSNAFTEGLNVGSSMVPQVLVIPGSTGGQGSSIAFPFNTADDTGSTVILGQLVNQGLANQYLQLAIEGPVNANDTAFQQYQTLYNSASDDNTQTANMLVVDQAGNIYLGFSNDTSPAMSIGQPPAGASAGLPSTFIPITMNGALLTYSSSAGGTYSKTFTANGTMVFPAGVTTARVQVWGSSAGGQFASGPGGGSGEYAEEAILPVTAGPTYTATVPAGGNGGTSGSGTGKSGATAIFSQGVTNLVVAHGAPVNSTNPSTGGTGSTNTIHHNGGGCTCVSTGTAKGGGGGAGSVFPTGTVNNGGSNYGSAGNGPGAGGTGYLGNGGNGGWGATQSQNTSAGSAGGVAAGGGSGGAIGASSGQNGGKGGRAQIIVTYTVPGSTPLAAAFASAAGTDTSGNAYAAGYTGPVTAVQPSSSPSAVEAWHYVLNGVTGTLPTGGTSSASNYIRYKLLAESNFACINFSVAGTTFASGVAIMTPPAGYLPAKQQICAIGIATSTAQTSGSPRAIINTSGSTSCNGWSGSATSITGTLIYPLD